MTFDLGRYKSRKYQVTLLIILSADFFLYHGKISDTIFSAILLGIGTAYITGNSYLASKKITP